MTFHVDSSSGVPIFRQLMDQIKLRIASGELAPGDELPSIRSLSIPLGVNPMTISKAYNLLVHENVLVRRPGKPLVVADLDPDALAARKMQQLAARLEPVVRLTRNLNIPTDQAAALFRQLLVEADRRTGNKEDDQ